MRKWVCLTAAGWREYSYHIPTSQWLQNSPSKKKKEKKNPAQLQLHLPGIGSHPSSLLLFPHSPQSPRQWLRHWVTQPNHCNIPIYFYLFCQSRSLHHLGQGWFYFCKATLLVPLDSICRRKCFSTNPNWIIVNSSIIKSVNQYGYISKETLHPSPLVYIQLRVKL